MAAPEETGAGGQAPQRQFAIQRVYVKDVSFESPSVPGIFAQEWRPEVNLNIGTASRAVGANQYEVTLTATVTVKSGEQTAFLVEVKQAGIFALAGFEEAELGPVLGSYCPNVLFPYLREAVSDLVSRGSFPQFLMVPVNFDSLYAQHLRQQQAGPAPASAPTH
jgi:preprotein translocase subunit SecB